MQDRRERIIEVVEQLAPLLITRGLAKTNLMMLYGFPANQQHVVVILLDTSLQLMSKIARHRRNDFLSEVKRKLEFLSVRVVLAVGRFR